MKPLHPVTIASRNLALDLARQITAAFPDFYAAVPPDYLALNIRDILRFCEDNDMWEPADQAMVVTAMFRPAPELLPLSEREYILRTLAQSGTTPAARARTIALALTATLPPARPVFDTQRG